MTFDPALTISNLPLSPGVYRFYGAGDLLLYIGKAKRLKNRVSSYFSPTKLAQNPRLQLMVSQIEKIEYTVVKTEHESIILEANLIHSLQPKFNILLKDDRSYLYVRISGGNEIVGSQTKFILKEWQVEKHTNKIITFEPNSQRTQNPETNFVQTSFSDGKFLDAKDLIPTVSLTRRKYDKKSDYFGPYTKRYGIFNVLRVIRTIFPYCEKKVYDNKPCSYVQLKQCDGICCGLETIAEYNGRLNQIKKVLKGDSAEVKTGSKIKSPKR